MWDSCFFVPSVCVKSHFLNLKSVAGEMECPLNDFINSFLIFFPHVAVSIMCLEMWKVLSNDRE